MRIIMSFSDVLADVKIKWDWGYSLVGWLKNIIIFTAGFKIIFPELNYAGLFWLGFVCAVGIYILGWFDIKYLHIYQRLQNLNTGKYNPYFVKLDKNIRKRKV